MDNNRIIILLLIAIIVILIVGVIVFSQLMHKEDCQLKIKDKSIYVGDSFVVVLTDLNGNPISNETVNFKLTDKGGVTIDEDVATDSKGKAKLKVDENGKYSVECSFSGNGKYSPASVSGSLKVQKATTKSVGQEQSSTVTHTTKYASNGGMYPEYGPDVDQQGITREYAIAHDMHYIEMDIDGKTSGGYTAVDPNTGTYHT